MVNEDIELENEIRRNRNMKDKDETRNILKLFALVLFIFIASYHTRGNTTVCPHCEKEIEIVKIGFFPDTWTCPNENCRYQNYEGINYCGLCGSSRLYGRECFEKRIDQEIEIVENCKKFFTDSSDIYMYYYLIGIQTGLSQSKQISLLCD